MASFDGAWLDSMYNNFKLVPAYATHIGGWRTRSAEAYRHEKHEVDLRYGDGANETLDIFPAAGDKAPVIVFIHGGYWRALDKSDHAFLAPALTKAGACVVIPNYALCPAVDIPHITMQMVRALAWVWRNIGQYGGDPSRITVVGHSAGGHLAAMMLACDWKAYGRDLPAHLVRNALSISGLHELESIMHTPFLKDVLQLTPEHATKASPAWLPAPRQGTLYAVAGGDESAEYHRQSHLIQDAWGRKSVPVRETLGGLNHFSMLEALAEPGHRVHALAVELTR